MMGLEADVQEGAGVSVGTSMEPSGTFRASNEPTEGMAGVRGQSYDVGHEGYASSPGIELNTGLRRELSPDVLASMEGASSGVVKPQEDDLDTTPMCEDTYFIPEIHFSPHRGAAVPSSDHVNYTSSGASPYSGSGAYLDAQFNCLVQLELPEPSTVEEEPQQHPQDDHAVESPVKHPDEDPVATTLENSSGAPFQLPFDDMGAPVASLSLPERDGSTTQCEAYPASSGAVEESTGATLPIDPVSFDTQDTVNAAAAFPISSAAGCDGFNTTSEADDKSITSPTIIPASSEADMTTADENKKEELTPSDLGESAEKQSCIRVEDIATCSTFGFQLGPPTAFDGSDLSSSVSTRKETFEFVVEETPAAYDNTTEVLPEGLDYRVKSSDGGGLPADVPTHFQSEDSVTAGSESAGPKAEPSEQVSTPTEHAVAVAASTSEAAEVRASEDSYDDEHVPGFAQLPVEDHAATSEVSQVDRQPGVITGLSLCTELSTPSESVVPQSAASGAAEFSGRSAGITKLSVSKADSTPPLDPTSSSAAEALAGESNIGLQSFEPSQIWDLPTSSGRSVPSLSSVSSYFGGTHSPFRGRKTARRKKPSDSVVDGREKTSVEMLKQEDVGLLGSMIDAQKKAMLSQIDELQRIVTMQCELTGKNPLSEEMVSEVLWEDGSEKKSSEQPSAEAERYMREVFAIKDTITKKEARAISSMFGATVSQVRDFFTAQKTLAEKLVQQVLDETGRVALRNATDQSSPLGVERDLGLDRLTSSESIERYLELMRAERTFYGQMQLTQIILRTDAAAGILRRFLEKGALKVLHQWLAEAAAEEQTSVLRQLLTTLAHLPISSSAAHQLPALVQIVNKLRFYRNLDVSAQARALLAHWSKMLKRKSGAVKPSGSAGNKPVTVVRKNSATTSGGVKRTDSATPSGGVKRTDSASTSGGVKRNSDAVTVGSGSRKRITKEEEISQADRKTSGLSAQSSPRVTVSTVELSPPAGQPPATAPQQTKQRWSTTLQPSESAVAAVSVSRKRGASKTLGDHTNERRKIQLVEDTAGNTLPPGPKSTAVKSTRPISTDDIYKAKKLQRLLQEPLTKSRKKPSPGRDIDRQTSAGKKELLILQQREVSRRSHDNSLSTDKHDAPPLYKQTLLSVSTSERSATFQLEEFLDQPTISPPLSPDRAPRTMTPTSSPGRPDLIITPTSSPGRPDLIITPTSSPGRPDLIITPTSSPGGPQVITTPAFSSPDRQGGVVKRSSPLAPPQDSTAASLSSEDERQGAVAPMSSVFLQTATVVDSSNRSSYRLSPSLTSELSAAGLQVISPHSSNIGLIESVSRSEPSSQPSAAADVIGHDLTPVSREDNDGSGEEGRSFASKEISADRELQQHQVGEVQALPIPSSSPQEEEAEVPEVKQVVVDSSNSQGIASQGPPIFDYFAALRSSMIRWRIPPVYELAPQWNVAAGEESKEKEVQLARVKREEEAYYPDLSSIPSDPKDPWEEEPNYDDSLTFEIYLDNSQRKPVSGMQTTQADYMNWKNLAASGTLPTAKTSISMFGPQNVPDASLDASRKDPSVSGLSLPLQQQLSASGGLGHDPALLSLLLRNPDLVSQLTSGQSYNQTEVLNQMVHVPLIDVPRQQPSNVANSGSGFRMQAGDTNLHRFRPPDVQGAGVHSLRPADAAPSMTQLPPEGMRGEDPSLKHLSGGIGHQQKPGFVSQAGMDVQYPAPSPEGMRFEDPSLKHLGGGIGHQQHNPGFISQAVSEAQYPAQQPQVPPAMSNIPRWEQGLMAPPLPPLPPPPMLPPMLSGSNQLLQQPMQSQTNQVITSWHESQAWNNTGGAVGRPPLNAAQIHSGQEQFHMSYPQNIMYPNNVRSPNYGVGGIPQVEVNSLVSQQEMHNASHQRQWSHGSHLVAAPSVNNIQDNSQDSVMGRNSRWQHRKSSRPSSPNSQLRPITREYSDFQGPRQTSVVENLGVTVPNDRGRAGSFTPYPDNTYRLPPPPPYPRQQWHQTPEWNGRPGPTSGVPPLVHGLDLRPQEPQLPPNPWYPGMGPVGRGPQ